jgi:hypothetical protein
MAQPCKDREHLEKELLIAVDRHMHLEEAMKTAAPSALAEARQQEERARAAWRRAANALKEHRAKHGC